MRRSKEPKAPARAVSLTAMCKKYDPSPWSPALAMTQQACDAEKTKRGWFLVLSRSLPRQDRGWTALCLPTALTCADSQCRDRGGELRKSHLTAPSERPLSRFL